MNKIIQEILEKVKGEIENNIIKTLEGGMNLDQMVDSVGDMVNNIGLDTPSAIVGELNKHIKDTPDRKGKYYVQRNNDKRSLVTRFGMLEFERDYYKNNKENKYIYILDKMLGIEKYEKVEANLKGQILDKASEVSYAKAAKYSSPVELTREAVKGIIRENGKIDNLELKVGKKKEVKTIYIEADEDHVAMQNGTNKEMKLIYVYDNKREENRGRIKLENLRYFTGEMNPEDLWTEVATYIDEAYDLDKVESMKRARRYISNNWNGIKNLYKYNYSCSAEGHISHILSTRLSSRPMGWSLVGLDEMARMRAYKASGGNIKEYYRKQRIEKNKEKRILELDEKVVKRIKNNYKSMEPDKMIEMPYTTRTDGQWLKNMLQISGI